MKTNPRFPRTAVVSAVVAVASLVAACAGGAPTAGTSTATSAAATPASSTATGLPQSAVDPATLGAAPAMFSIHVTLVKEPNDYAHRNYCGSGATQVLVSAWASVPDIETVAHLSKLDPNRGQTGANTVTAINTLIAPITAGVLGVTPYAGHHTVDVGDVLAAMRADLADARVTRAFGHGAPIMVQTMTKSLPGWHGWQATHMITIYAADLRTGDTSKDTVTYAETPSVIAAYGGPPSQTITVGALWAAMVEHNKDAPDDPVNLIDLAR